MTAQHPLACAGLCMALAAARTRAAYEAHGLGMLLTDINARDGKIYGVGLPIATPPFYNGAEEIEQAALLRAHAGLYAGPP